MVIVNCFSGEIPRSLCQGHRLRTLSLDGLKGSPHCPNIARFPFSGVGLFNFMSGSIPSCVWLLQNLTFLHMSGNGFTGTISSTSFASVLKDVSLSHNQLTGSIPPFLKYVDHLDLSYNKLSGHYHGKNVSTASLILAVNRLSGDLHGKSMQAVPYLDVLHDNLFQCNSIPTNDEHYEFYICGSSDFDWSIFLLTCTISIIFVAFSVAFVSNRTHAKSSQPLISLPLGHLYSKMVLYMSVFSRNADYFEKTSRSTQRIISFAKELLATSNMVLWLCALFIFVSAPIYIIRAHENAEGHSQSSFSTHNDAYRWFWTVAYFTGQIPTIILVGGWVIVVCTWYKHVDAALPSEKSTVVANDISARKRTSSRLRPSVSTIVSSKNVSRRTILLLVVFNVCFVISVNSAYVYSLHREYSPAVHYVFQLVFALFKLLYTFILVPVMASMIEEPLLNIWFRLKLLIVSNLVIPVLVVAVRSPSCFQGLFFEADDIISSYSYDVCELTALFAQSKQCLKYESAIVEISPLTPPFTYSYQCSSRIITAYVPVFVYIYSFQILLPAIYLSLLSFLNYEDIPKPCRLLFHAVMWPNYWVETKLTNEIISRSGMLLSDPFLLLDSRDIITTDVLNSMIVLLTFGFCSPILACAIACSMWLKLNMWVMLIGRFCCAILGEKGKYNCSDNSKKVASSTDDKNESSESEFANGVAKIEFENAGMRTISQGCVQLCVILHLSFWPLLWSSALFMVLISWEICSDEVGWAQSLWAPGIVITIPICLKILEYIRGFEDVTSYSEDEEEENIIEIIATNTHHSGVQNPILASQTAV